MSPHFLDDANDMLRRCQLALDAANVTIEECKRAHHEVCSISTQAEQTIHQLREQITKIKAAIERSQVKLQRLREAK